MNFRRNFAAFRGKITLLKREIRTNSPFISPRKKRHMIAEKNEESFSVYIRGLLFKFVDFLYSRSEVFDRVIIVISSENVFFSLSFDV